MKFCYLDESGTGGEPFAVMVGIITDVMRMKKTKEDWAELLQRLSARIGRTVGEIHTRELYRGNRLWNKVTAADRTIIIQEIIDWLNSRKHTIVYSCVDKTAYKGSISGELGYTDYGTLWRFMALHCTLSIQKSMQNEKKNKGNTLLIFDSEVAEQGEFTKLLLSPPGWTDTYYGKHKKQDRLDQIIDVPHFVDSKQVGLIQIADFCAYFIRLYLELTAGASPEKYPGELQVIQNWVQQILENVIPKSNIYPKKGRCATAELFYKYGVPQLK